MNDDSLKELYSGSSPLGFHSADSSRKINFSSETAIRKKHKCPVMDLPC